MKLYCLTNYNGTNLETNYKIILHSFPLAMYIWK